MDARVSSKLLKITSKAGLAYVGKLHAVDIKHSTVTLSKVRVVSSANGDQIYPQVYNYVIFRGSDIKDVSLLENSPHDILLENDLAVSFKDRVLCDENKTEPVSAFNPDRRRFHPPSNRSLSMLRLI
nr:unnamed protein product [Spirometra erinaceieuropaei]